MPAWWPSRPTRPTPACLPCGPCSRRVANGLASAASRPASSSSCTWDRSRSAGSGEEIVDVYGKTVNVAAALPSSGLAITPAVFRSLQAETRKLFKKHTPPISYIDADDPRPT
jgi:hypothetical protein